MKKMVILHSLMGFVFLYVCYRMGVFKPLRQIFSWNPTRGDILESFPEAGDDGAKITWFHAANSRATLKRALDGPYMFIESDILVGNDGSIIMAHPPATTSDLTYEEWLHSFQKQRDKVKGMKLDFKSTDPVVPCLKALSSVGMDLKGPVIVNADIMQGPNAESPGLHAASIIVPFKTHYPHALLSIGWTTGDGRAGYTWPHVYRMYVLIKKHGLLPSAERPSVPKITFPVRASLINVNVVGKLLWLLHMVPDSSLTVWASVKDHRKSLGDLLLLRFLTSKRAVFYDIAQAFPRDALKSFQAHIERPEGLGAMFADTVRSDLKNNWDMLGPSEGQFLLAPQALLHSGLGVGLVSLKEVRSTFRAQTDFSLVFYPFANDGKVPKCSVQVFLRSTNHMTNELVLSPAVSCRLELPSGRASIQASGEGDAALVEERLEIGDKAVGLGYRLTVQDDGQRVAFSIIALAHYDEPVQTVHFSKRLVLPTTMNNHAYFRPAVTAMCSGKDSWLVLHDLKV